MDGKNKGNIFILDDAPNTLRILMNILTEKGYRVRIAKTAKEAFSSIFVTLPDLILLDISMPDLCGYQVCKQLKTNEATHEIPIIFLSSLNDIDDKVKGFEVGAVDYITKPFQIEEVLARVHTHLELSRRKELNEKLKKVNLKLLEAKAIAEKANYEKSMFIANISHELRTPLNAILGYSQLILRNKSLPQDAQNQIKIINNSGQHLLSLINQVLETSKIAVGHETLLINNFNLHSLIKEVEIMFREKSESKNLVFQITGIENIPEFVYTDETKLKIVLINLIGNAIKFTENGYVIARFSVERLNKEEFRLFVEIEDTGFGISEEDSKKLFTYFSQTESGQKSNSGTGLGLAISKEYIKLMGGEISHVKDYKKGCLFRFNIVSKFGYAIDKKNPSQYRYIKGLESGQKPPKILIAEDNTENRVLLTSLLSETGFEVRSVENGLMAIETWEQWQPDFIWMDIRMPVMDGMEATRKIKAKLKGENTKIVALSAHVLGNEKDEIIKSGCDGFIAKPYEESAIFETMKKLLGIEYSYEIKNEKNNEDIKMDLNFSSLESNFLAELSAAADSTDMSKITQLAYLLKKTDSDTAAKLLHLADEFEYEPIKEAITKTKEGGKV